VVQSVVVLLVVVWVDVMLSKSIRNASTNPTPFASPPPPPPIPSTRSGHEIYRASTGYRDVELGLPMETNTICRLMSQTKPVTAVAVMMLVESGKV